MAGVKKGDGVLERYRFKRWMEDWPLEAPFPGMVSGINKFGEAYWATPVKHYTKEEIADYVLKSGEIQ